MLEYLRIRNLALIDDAALEFAPGLNVLTGETGAGKSFILKALDFLLGESLGVDNVRPGADAALVEALFRLGRVGRVDEAEASGPEGEEAEPASEPGGELVIRRELSRITKRGRAFLNDRLASQARLKELSGSLMLLAGQNAQRRLLSPAEQARFLDAFLPDPSVLAARDAGLAGLRAALGARAEFEARAGESASRRGLLEFQREQIEALAPAPNEEAELAAAKAGLAAAERARKRADAALGSLLGGYGAGEGALAGLRQAVRELAGLAESMPDAPEWAAEWTEARTTAEECLERLAAVADRLRRGRVGPMEPGGAGAQRLDVDAIESRLFSFSSLRRKLGTPPLIDDRPVSDLAEWLTAVQAELSFIDELELERSRLDKAEAQARARAQAACDALGQARRAAASRLGPRLNAALAELGFSRDVDAPFVFEPREIAPGVHEDRPRLLFAPNPGMPPRDLAETASGGELSRVFLALTTLAANAVAHDAAALVFDEVDAGIGGLTLDRVGAALRALSSTRQVVLVTHWSRLARLVGPGDRHFKVEKRVEDGQTFTVCRQLDEAGRLAELARMDGRMSDQADEGVST